LEPSRSKWWNDLWSYQRKTLVEVHASFKVWTDWYDRRLRGKALSFDFPDDSADAEFHRRLAEADEEWWARPIILVNDDLAAWIEELRVRITDPATMKTHRRLRPRPNPSMRKPQDRQGPRAISV
jgi:hypothetical protein